MSVREHVAQLARELPLKTAAAKYDDGEVFVPQGDGFGLVFGRLFIPGPLLSMNDIISLKATKFGRGMDAYAKTKRHWGGLISMLARHARLGAIGPSYFTYLFRERDRRRDPSNFVAGGVKIIEDGLQEAGLLDNDGWNHVLGFTAHWVVDAEQPGCTVFVHAERLLTKDEAIALDRRQT